MTSSSSDAIFFPNPLCASTTMMLEYPTSVAYRSILSRIEYGRSSIPPSFETIKIRMVLKLMQVKVKSFDFVCKGKEHSLPVFLRTEFFSDSRYLLTSSCVGRFLEWSETLCRTIALFSKNLNILYGKSLPPIGLNGPGCTSGKITNTLLSLSLSNSTIIVFILSVLDLESNMFSIFSCLLSVQADRNACRILNVLFRCGYPALSASIDHINPTI